MSIVSPVYGNLLYRTVDKGTKFNKRTPKGYLMPAPVAGRIWLNVPFDQKDRAKSLGARWDAQHRSWWVPKHYKDQRLWRWVVGKRRHKER